MSIMIGERIIELRSRQKISTNKLANLAGVSQSYLREIELGIKNPTVEILSYLCDALGISLCEFFSETPSDINPFLLTALKQLSDTEQIKLADFINTLKSKTNKKN